MLESGRGGVSDGYPIGAFALASLLSFLGRPLGGETGTETCLGDDF